MVRLTGIKSCSDQLAYYFTSAGSKRITAPAPYRNTSSTINLSIRIESVNDNRGQPRVSAEGDFEGLSDYDILILRELLFAEIIARDLNECNMEHDNIDSLLAKYDAMLHQFQQRALELDCMNEETQLD